MSLVVPRHGPVLVRANEAEHLESIGHTLLADASATGGALSTHAIRLGRGQGGALPHRHDNASELFYIVDGELDVLIDAEVVTGARGDLLVVPPGMTHAFAAGARAGAEALIVVTPGIERFEYFRHVIARRDGTEPASVLDALQDRFDTHFVQSDAWSERLATGPAAGGPR